MKWRLLIVMSCLLALFFNACKSRDIAETTPSPEKADPAQLYLTAWQQQDYAGMYKLLTVKSITNMTESQFIERYQKIYEGIGAEHLAVNLLPENPAATLPTSSSATPEPKERSFHFHVKMDTVAGPVEFDQQGKLTRAAVEGSEEKSEWLVDWTPSMIFPGLAEGDKVRVQTVVGERGEILDRNGNGLAINAVVPQLGLVPEQMGDSPNSVKAALAEKLGMETKIITDKLNASWVKPGMFVPIAIIPEIAIDEYRTIPGVVIQEKKLRQYPYGEAAAHLTGYIGEANAEELDKLKDKGYKTGDWIGKAGLEQVLEEKLRGTDGVVISIVDSGGQQKANLAEKAAVPGQSFQLTIDAELQKSIYGEVQDDGASVAAIQPQTGDVLALLSSPSYDPNAFVQGVSSEQYKKWNDDPHHPFLNRFSKGYAPGSSFKLVTAAIGLDSSILNPEEGRAIAGLTWSKDGSWGNYYVKRIHAVNPVNLSQALLFSDNIYFAQAALEIGKEKFAEESTHFGIGESIPLDYPLNKSQLAKEAIQSDIQLADTGYGQGQVTMTSLHVALVYSALVNNGDMVYPHLIKESGTEPSLWKKQAMSSSTASLLKNDLINAVSSPEGVGHGAYIPGASIAGKTGTAELKASKDADGQENGWFVGFDADKPDLLLSVMIEDVKGRGGSGYVTGKVKSIFRNHLKE